MGKLIQKANIMTVKAIFFGSIGTLVETSDLQRRAFNQAFSEADLDWNWSAEVYQQLLTKSGGRDRIQDFANHHGTDVDASQLHLRKTEIFDGLMAQEALLLRPGIASVIVHAKANNWPLAFVTSTSKANVDAVFVALGDQIKRSDFSFVGNDTMVTNAKPNPDIYQKALSDLNLEARDCMAIEDTVASMASALAAGIACIGFPGAFAEARDFKGAVLVTDELSPNHLMTLDT